MVEMRRINGYLTLLWELFREFGSVGAMYDAANTLLLFYATRHADLSLPDSDHGERQRRWTSRPCCCSRDRLSMLLERKDLVG